MSHVLARRRKNQFLNENKDDRKDVVTIIIIKRGRVRKIKRERVSLRLF